MNRSQASPSVPIGQPLRREKPWQPDLPGRTGGDVAAGEQGDHPPPRPSHDRQRKRHRRLRREAVVAVEETWPAEPRPAVSSVTAGSSRVPCRLPVPPPLTNRMGATDRTAATISVRRPSSWECDRRFIIRTAGLSSGTRDLGVVEHHPLDDHPRVESRPRDSGRSCWPRGPAGARTGDQIRGVGVEGVEIGDGERRDESGGRGVPATGRHSRLRPAQPTRATMSSANMARAALTSLSGSVSSAARAERATAVVRFSAAAIAG